MMQTYPMDDDYLPQLTLSIATTPFHMELLGSNEEVIAMVMAKMMNRIPENERNDMELTERHLKEVIVEIHEPAIFMKVKDWHYIVNLTGINLWDVPSDIWDKL